MPQVLEFKSFVINPKKKNTRCVRHLKKFKQHENAIKIAFITEWLEYIIHH